MYKKLTTLLFSLLLAIGWTNTAQAQKLTEGTPWFTSPFFKKMVQPTNTEGSSSRTSELTYQRKEAFDVSRIKGENFQAQHKAPLQAPRRADFSVTASATHVKSWYDSKHYTWYDAGNQEQTASYTDPVTDPRQMYWFTRSLYTDKTMPGIKYTEAYNADLVYQGIDFGYFISGDIQHDIVISMSDYVLINGIGVYDYQGNEITSYFASSTTLPEGWTMNNSDYLTRDTDGEYYFWTFGRGNDTDQYPAFTISKDLLRGHGGVYVMVRARQFNSSSATRNYTYSVDYHNYQPTGEATSGSDYVGELHLLKSTWDVYETMCNAPIDAPDENGYSVVLVKLTNEFDYESGRAEEYTYTLDDLYNYFGKYVTEMQLLTDGTRLNEGSDDAGTMFSYSGTLNKFYFIGKGKTYPLGSSENLWTYDNNGNYERFSDIAPFYSMYEEFSPTTQSNTTGIDDFYSKLLYGNSYNIIHDCQSVNYMEHFFSMTGKNGTENKSMTNLILWIPDNRGQYKSNNLTRDYDEEYLPHVGLYTITLEAEAHPAANYSASNRMYDVTCDWVSSLNSILDFDVDQDYELWIYEYDDDGNPVAQEKVTDLIVDENGIIHNSTTHTYQVEQLPESRTIVYRVKGWPKDATNSPGKDKNGTFYALSNLDPVLIPGYKNFLSLDAEHYESDFVINEEHNYYRNFLTVDNQNPDNALTANRIENHEDQYQLWRFDVAKPGELTKAADLKFTVANNKVEYDITYANQSYVDEANLYNEVTNSVISGYTDPNALGCPTHGEIANISSGGSGEIHTISRTWDFEEESQASEFTFVDANSDNYNWLYFNAETQSEALKAHGGIGYMYSESYRNGYFSGVSITPNNWMISPEITLGGTLTFWASGAHSSDYAEKFGVYVYEGSYSSGITGFRQVGADYTTNYGWTKYTVDLSQYSGKGRFAIVHHNCSNMYRLKIDDIEIDNQPEYNDGLLNDFLDNSTYTQVGQVVFKEPWKSIQVKLQEESAGSASGFFVIQNNGRLRFIMPAGYNNANLRFVIHNAPASSNYYHGTFTLASSTGATKTISIPEGSDVYADRDYEAIFTGISTGDVITITGTHTHEGTLYHYSPDFKYIHVYVEGGHNGVSENTPLNLAAIKFVDQFKAETREDKHPYRYGYVLRSVPTDSTQEVQESAKPEFPVQHTGASLNGFYTLTELQEDTLATLKMNVMNAEVNMNLTTNPQVYYYTLDRKPSTTPDAAYLEISKLQKREDDTYQEMDNILSDYQDIFDPEVTPRYDNYNVMTGNYNSYMSYVPVAWTHGDLSNRRIKWDTEKRHNSYGAPIWKTGVAKVDMVSAIAERQKGLATNWTYNNEECSLYMLDDVEAIATMPTDNNVKYVPYMFRIFVKSKNHKLRGYTYVQADVDPNLPGSHFAGDVIDCDSLACVWSGYVNDPDNEKNGVTFNIDEENHTITFCKDKVDRTNPPTGVWDKSADQNAMFAALKDIIKDDQTTTIDENDLTIFVRFYYIVEGFNADKPAFMLNRGESPAGYGAESGSKSPSPMTAVNEISYKGEVVSQTYYNVQGMASDKPFSGVNIVIKRYSDGTTVTTKEVR